MCWWISALHLHVHPDGGAGEEHVHAITGSRRPRGKCQNAERGFSVLCFYLAPCKQDPISFWSMPACSPPHLITVGAWVRAQVTSIKPYVYGAVNVPTLLWEGLPDVSVQGFCGWAEDSRCGCFPDPGVWHPKFSVPVHISSSAASRQCSAKMYPLAGDGWSAPEVWKRGESAQSCSLSQNGTFLWCDLEEEKHMWPNLTKLNSCGDGADRSVG